MNYKHTSGDIVEEQEHLLKEEKSHEKPGPQSIHDKSFNSNGGAEPTKDSSGLNEA
jgi:hypothetical protein